MEQVIKKPCVNVISNNSMPAKIAYSNKNNRLPSATKGNEKNFVLKVEIQNQVEKRSLVMRKETCFWVELKIFHLEFRFQKLKLCWNMKCVRVQSDAWIWQKKLETKNVLCYDVENFEKTWTQNECFYRQSKRQFFR